MLTYDQEQVMINSILDRRSKHLAQLERDSASPSQKRVWKRFYERLLGKYSVSFEVKYYG
ncbi:MULTISPECIES: hypothetical protein [unclassified Lysinibacillus]|uniref:hypothetical protein n=1 Tax=unclassified Lysinibacillus TaxID=2636778 RepID=UPI003819CA20